MCTRNFRTIFQIFGSFSKAGRKEIQVWTEGNPSLDGRKSKPGGRKSKRFLAQLLDIYQMVTATLDAK
jgi:hypothetical protein